MVIRQIDKDNKFDAYLISSYCFHSRIDDVESKRGEIEAEEFEDWGAFDEDGTLMARVGNFKYDFYLDGKTVKSGGIGAVSTLPEYREKGAVREIFKLLLPEAYKNGEVISCLFPFNHSFYRKQGYEVVTYQSNYEIKPELLRVYRSDAGVKRYNPGESVAAYTEVYNTFAKNYNFAMPRDEKKMLEHMKVDILYRDRQFSYLFLKDGENIAYLTFKDTYHNPAAILHVEECAWVNRDGFYAILAFLGKFAADYGNIELPLPAGIDLLRLVQTPKAYEIHKTTRTDYMVRVINAKALMEAMKKPGHCDFVMQVHDDIIGENNCLLHVTKWGVETADAETPPDIELDVRALGQLATGCINLDEAMLRPDVQVFAKEDMLRWTFREKKILVTEHF